MNKKQINEINMKMENEFGAGGISLTETSLGGTQITWGETTCVGHADSETLHELILELTRLKEHIDKAEGRW